MIDPVRQEVLTAAHTVVVKVGTNVLTGTDGLLSRDQLQALADQLQRIRAGGKRVVLVSSGAIGAGMGRLGLGKRPDDLRHLQACAAIGQSLLMRAYEECLAKYDTPTATARSPTRFSHRPATSASQSTLARALWVGSADAG